MDLARVSAKGQVTIPIDIRKKLNIREGDKILFAEKNGNITIINATMNALKEVQADFAGEAEKAGFKDEQDIIDYIADLRREREGLN